MIAKDDKIILTVQHEVFLTREERYKLVEGEEVETLGVSVPVWVLQKSGKTTEPAPEIFCHYRIINDKEQAQQVKKTKTGYIIRLPQIPEDLLFLPRPDDDEWREMTLEARDDWFYQNRKPPNPNCLKDRTDGGGEYLRFEKQRKAKFKNGPYIQVVHWVEIKSIESLKQSLLT
jgi:hypothetical protein